MLIPLLLQILRSKASKINEEKEEERIKQQHNQIEDQTQAIKKKGKNDPEPPKEGLIYKKGEEVQSRGDFGYCRAYSQFLDD
jgi:hypothetical protein